MKGEYVEEKDHSNDMFAKLKFQHHHQPPTLAPHHHHQQHHFQLISDEADAATPSASTTPTSATPTAAITTTTKDPTSDGATIEVVRRPRGRPPGSKNKPKPPVIITREPDPSMTMSPYFLEVPAGADVVGSVTRFCRKNNTGLCVLTASGAVANVSLRQPTTPGAAVTFHGRFDLLSLSATILPAAETPTVGSGFAISLACPQGQIIGGTVVGPLFAAATVYVVAASFNNPSFHRLPAEEDGRNSGGSVGGNEEQSPPAVSGGGDGGHQQESCGLSVYSGHMPSDVIWAPTARQPPPHYG